MTPAEELRAAATRLEKAAATHDGDKVDVWAFAAEWMDPWVQLMSPPLAAPLAGLLRAAAEMQDIADGAYAATRDRSLALLGPEPSRPAPAPNVARALAVARVVNGGAS